MLKKSGKIISVVGTRPNFVKLAPLCHSLQKHPTIHHVLVHTGQHYDPSLSDNFFKSLDIPQPDHFLNVGSGSHAKQTAEIMSRFEDVVIKEKPDCVAVFGDVNSTMAAALVCAKLQIPVVHIEAGLRSFDREMPEEINRLVTDQLSDLLLTPSLDADQNLLNEGIPREKIKHVGNIMIDTLVRFLSMASPGAHLKNFSVSPKAFAYVTLHRPSNVDQREKLAAICESFTRLSKDLTIVWPVHPRTKQNLEKFELWAPLTKTERIRLIPPVDYFESLSLTQNARLLITDSGGLQEEATFLKVPCLTLRPNTERPITITHGTNRLTTIEALDKDIPTWSQRDFSTLADIPLWDGRASSRVVEEIIGHF